VSENKVLRRIFGLKRVEVPGRWQRLYNGEFCNLYSSPNIIRMIKSRRAGWVGHVTRMGTKRREFSSDTLSYPCFSHPKILNPDHYGSLYVWFLEYGS
jgi:hypothetical protein